MRLLLLVLLIISLDACAQDYDVYHRTLANLYQAGASGNSDQVEQLWTQLVQAKSIPLTQHDSVAFLYRGNANTVSWMGDFNGWGYDKKFVNKGNRIPNTDIWVLRASFPKDARLDYKILVNDAEWILDPNNDYQQWSGVGGGSPNSELRMPEWKPDPVTMPHDQVKPGKLTQELLFNSKILGYQLMYSVYLPSNYQPGTTYPVIYVTDGYEYLHERMGNMKVVLDNLIDQKKIEPVIAVFIDHREPVNRANNRRMTELALNNKYLTFFRDEFIPQIEKNYPVSRQPDGRAILGTSMGGLTAAYFAFQSPGLFGLAGIQSPAFWFKPEIYKMCENPENPPVKIYMTSGTVNDTAEGARKMRDILDRSTCTYQYQETHQGHSWGNWRDSLDDILIYFFPYKS